MSQLPNASVERLTRNFGGAAPEGTAPERSELAAEVRVLAFAEGGAQSVPACRACYGPQSAPINPAFPSRAGQHAPYVAQHLTLWREGNRGRGRAAELMFKASKDLTDEEIAALAAHYLGLEPAKLDDTGE
ncbi:Cytochrome c4 precursor [Roseovarius sp. THAF9]|uniref:c-type cytochrome n=1 Tax=Roseovarius sp. THAF9 TaxID=2587847 RepID=UPI0012688B32|nr:hypothetical protein [Roseovarius sp. THAF9]QFT92364.1 Cytochrome c4 precursor [Roseovarius sp. THAF9]